MLFYLSPLFARQLTPIPIYYLNILNSVFLPTEFFFYEKGVEGGYSARSLSRTPVRRHRILVSHTAAPENGESVAPSE